MKKEEPKTNSMTGEPVGGMIFSTYKTLPEIIDDRAAIRRELKASRERRTVRIKPSLLP